MNCVRQWVSLTGVSCTRRTKWTKVLQVNSEIAHIDRRNRSFRHPFPVTTINAKMSTNGANTKIVPMKEAKESLLEVDEGIQVWYQTWGNLESGIPVLFVHGGPGNCVADYEGINEKFFDKTRFFVIEVDQRGTGKSQVTVTTFDIVFL